MLSVPLPSLPVAGWLRAGLTRRTHITLWRAGFNKENAFELGKTYTVIGYAARDGSLIAFVEQLTLPNGRTVRIWFGDPNGSN